MQHCFTSDASSAIPLEPIQTDNFGAWLEVQSPMIQAWCEANAFKAQDGKILLCPDQNGKLAKVCVGAESFLDRWSLAGCPLSLPQGVYALTGVEDLNLHSRLVTAWGLGSYQFTRYKQAERAPAQLVVSEECLDGKALAYVESHNLVRDLINTPANDMGPTGLMQAAQSLAKKYQAKFNCTVGDKLLAENFPVIHAVGRAAADEPRLIELRFGRKGAPKLTLIGKGVCFDTGGLDLKPSSNMILMKKDMGGAAHVLGLANYLAATELDVDCRVLIPAVENSVSGNSMRPSDVITGRSGKTIENNNTDAEGRLVLSDAITLACEDEPDLIIDFATLTGAARVALGTDLPALFCNNDAMANELVTQGQCSGDPLWHMPLFRAYKDDYASKIADLANCGTGSGYGGAITAALFLEEFVSEGTDWMHLDLMAWNCAAKPGRPCGGEALGIATIASWLESWRDNR